MGLLKSLFRKQESKQQGDTGTNTVRLPDTIEGEIEKPESPYLNNPRPLGDDPLAHISRSVELNASREDVWKLITDTRKWNEWYGTGIKSINPGWQKDAKVYWQSGAISRIGEICPLEEIGMVGENGVWLTWRVSQVGDRVLSISLTEDRLTCLTMERAFSRHQEMDKMLEKLRDLLEVEMSLRWKLELSDGGDTGNICGPVKLGEILIAVAGNKLHAVDTNGSLKWTYDGGWGCNPLSPVAFCDRVIFNDLSNKVCCLDIFTGSKLWEATPGGPLDQPPAYDGKSVYLTNRDGRMFALNGKTGKVLWSIEKKSRMSSPVVVNDRLFAVGTDYGSGFVTAMNTKDGSTVWSVNLNPMSFRVPVIVDELVYVSTKTGLCILDGQTGKIRSEFNFYKGDKSAPAVTGGKAYFRTDNHGVCCVDSLSGNIIWQYTAQSQYSDSAGTFERPAVASGCVCCELGDAHLYCMGSESGTPLWKQPVKCTDAFAIDEKTVYYMNNRALCAKDI
ncbi:MAG: PQQ-binding-like beta-propeller repeat protein [Clostridia bacterium]|nr:PQQ-binding-like beta-propeller repeat protein [Clostridia bacterium]